jgi:hypothetical protein
VAIGATNGSPRFTIAGFLPKRHSKQCFVPASSLFRQHGLKAAVKTFKADLDDQDFLAFLSANRLNLRQTCGALRHKVQLALAVLSHPETRFERPLGSLPVLADIAVTSDRSCFNLQPRDMLQQGSACDL